MNYTTNDLATTVKTYIENGWCPIPIPAGQKQPPPLKSTGKDSPALTPDQIAELWGGRENSNLALRLQGNAGLEGLEVIALDVDSHGGKIGGATLAELKAEFGEMPETWTGTRHGAGHPSRHYFFLVPAGLAWPGKAGEAIDILQFGHRYAVAYPSTYEGQLYRWYRPEGELSDEIPAVVDLPRLPDRWVKGLTDGNRPVSAPRGYVRNFPKAVLWLSENINNADDEMDPLFVRWFEGEELEQFKRELSQNGHDTMYSKVSAAVHAAYLDLRPGLSTAIYRISELFAAEMATPGRSRRLSESQADGEVKSAVAHAVNKVAGKTRIDWEKLEALYWETFAQKLSDGSWLSRPEVEPGAPEDLEAKRAAAVAAVEASAPEDYWQKYPVLAEIAHYATRAAVDKYSLLFRVLTYLSSEMPPTVYLEDIGQPLTLYSAVIAESGAGKGVLDKVADALVSQRLYNGDPVLRPGTGNMHTLLTALGDFTLPPLDKETGEQTMPMKKHRMLIQGNELAAWAEMQGNAEWAGTMADVFDGRGDYQVRNEGNRYHFGLDQHSLAVTFSVQPDAARYLFASTGRGLPGRFLISALPPQERVLPEDFDPWNLDSDFEVDTFDPARDVSRLKINSRFFLETGPFHLSDDARKANARLKRAWDEGVRENRRLREEKIFSQMPKVRLRVAVLLSVLLDLGEGREVPLEALKMADFLLKVSVENTRYARSLADRAERKVNAAVAATRKRADADADLSLAKENVLSVIDKSKSGKAGLGRINDRKRVTAEHHPAAIAELVVEGVLEVIKTPKAPDAYKRV